MNNMLATIAQKKHEEIQHAKVNCPIESMALDHCKPPRDFVAALRQSQPAIIAEIKKGSPSKGVIRQDFDVARIAQEYSQNGAACLSVLTDETFFYGHNEFIQIAKEQCQCPVLRKDFILDPYQVFESRFLGADCILLIVAMLSDQQLSDLCHLASTLSLAVLVESHNEAELERALQLPTPLIGINNRDLDTFTTDISTSLRLREMIPEDKIVISESGIESKQDLSQLRNAGIHSFLIGEAFMRKGHPGEYLKSLLNP